MNALFLKLKKKKTKAKLIKNSFDLPLISQTGNTHILGNSLNTVYFKEMNCFLNL